MNKTILYQLLALLLLFGITTTSNAQVTIGAGDPPKSFSVLELSTKSTKGGLRLPHLTPDERKDLDFEALAAKASPTEGELDLLKAAQGLTIYNTTSQCVEYWDTREWISLCTSSASFSFNNPNPPAIDGENGGETPPIKPEGGGGCTQNPPYTVEIVAGQDYVVSTDIVTEPTTGEFQIKFYPNPTAFPRYVIVRVTDNCTNLFRDLPFQQTGNLSLCQGDPVKTPVINSKSGGAGVDATLCNGGEVPLWLTNPDDTYTYIWTLNGIEIQGATGTTYTATKGGNYGVVVGAMGCMNGISAAKKMVEDKTNQAGPAPLITATNSGVICGGADVVLHAYNGTTPLAVDWYKDGFLTTTSTSKSINKDTDAGRWTAYASDACGSKRSNELTIEFDNTTPSGLPALAISINDVDIILNPEICKGGTMTVEVTNAAAYASLNPKYTWLVNGAKVSEGINPKVVINVPAADNLTLEVQLVTLGKCPLSRDYSQAITPTELPKPKLNQGVTEGFICGTAQGKSLEADITDGTQYEWIRNNMVKEQTATATVNYREAGSYQVRYKKGNCWSPLSNPIELKYQAFLSLTWDNNTPPVNEVIGTVKTIGAYTAPEAVSYTWASSEPTIVKVTPLLGNNRFATIEYLEVGTAKITVTATNECGSTHKDADVETETGCSPITNLNFTKKPATGVTGSELTYEISYTGGGDVDADLRFDWVVRDAANSIEANVPGTGSAKKVFNHTFATNGKYTVTVTAYDICQAAPDRKTITQALTINPSEGEVGAIKPAPTGTYSMSGAICYDIAKDGSNLAGRKNSFLDASNNEQYEFTYELLGTPMTEISVFTLGTDANTLLTEAPILNGTTITLKFNKSGVKSVNPTGLKFDLVAIFKNTTGGTQYKLVKSIVVKDQACCGAATVGGGWLTFMCHNLGADESLDPFEWNNSKGNEDGFDIKGDLYQWGRKADGHQKRNSGTTSTLATTNTPDHAGFINTKSTPRDWRAGGGNLSRWGDGSQNINQPKGTNDPCPTGWKVPSYKQWAATFKSMTSKTPNKWTYTGKGYMVGDALYLPMAGFRYEDISGIHNVTASCMYWSSTTYGDESYLMQANLEWIMDPAQNRFYRARALSVRCVAD